MKKRRKEKKKRQGERKRKNKRDRVLIGGKFLPLGKQKKLDCKLSEGSFLGKKGPKLPYFKEK
jgi:hypothetical protein